MGEGRGRQQKEVPLGVTEGDFDLEIGRKEEKWRGRESVHCKSYRARNEREREVSERGIFCEPFQTERRACN